MARKTGSRTATLVIVTTMGVLALAFAFQGSAIRTHYYCWRLDRTSAPEEAQFYWDRLVREIGQPGGSRAFVSNLGPRRPNLVFWTLHELRELQEAWPTATAEKLLFPISLRPLLPFIRDFTTQAHGDESLLAMVSHFHRRNGLESWEFGIDPIQPPPAADEWIEIDFSYEILDAAHKDPEAFEAYVRLQNLTSTAEIWTLGIEPPRMLAEFAMPRDQDDVRRLETAWESTREKIRTWLKERRGRLRFDARLGRCLEVLAGETAAPITVPKQPMPGWRGPAPPTHE